MKKTNFIKKILIFILAMMTIFISAIMNPIYAKSKEEFASLYFDNESSLSYIHSTNNFITPTIEAKGKDVNSLSLQANFQGKAISNNEIVYFNAKDFGLKDFSGCKVSADIYCDENYEDNTLELKLYSDGEQCVEKKITKQDKWVSYQINIGDYKNTIVGFSSHFKLPYEGNLCYIDNLKIEDSEGNILKIENVDDNETVINSSLTSIIYIVVLVLLVGLIGFSIFIVIKKTIFRYR